MKHPETLPELTRTKGQAGAVSQLLRWYRPYLRGHAPLLAWAILTGVIVLACQAVIPLVVEELLYNGERDVLRLEALVALIVLQIALGYTSHYSAGTLSVASAAKLRDRIFDHVLLTGSARQGRIARSSLITSHTTDVDNVSSAFESTLVEGLPGVIRVLQSLVLLTFIDWRAGATMTIAALAFIAIRRRIGRTMLVRDQDRLHMATRLAETVDESISTHRLLTGLNLNTWEQSRFHKESEDLEHASHRQGASVSQLVTAARATGLLGLVAVVAFGMALGDGGLATVAAALLYVEGVVSGLEALPGWVRSVQLGVVSQKRIDRILTTPAHLLVPPPALPLSAPVPGFALDQVTAALSTKLGLESASAVLPSGVVIGLVTPPGTDPDAMLELLSGQENPESGSVLLDGCDVRMPGTQSMIAYVAAEAVSFNASVNDQITAVNPTLDGAEISALLASVGLDHVEHGGGLDRPLGPMGARLNANERQRLALAIGLAAHPTVLVVGPLMALTDSETAAPLVDRLRQRTDGFTILSVRHPEVAESVDTMVYVDESGLHLGTHHELLVEHTAYANMWAQRLSGVEVDLSVLGIPNSEQATLQTRLVTERYAPGDTIYRQGDPADRIVFTISGRVEITAQDATGQERRVAVVGPGNHCGDLRLTVGERRAESTHALDHAVVRSLSREAVSVGILGLLDRTPTERRIIASLLRHGSGTSDEIVRRMPDIDRELITSSLALLTRDSAIREHDGILSVVHQRRKKPGSGALMDRLRDL